MVYEFFGISRLKKMILFIILVPPNFHQNKTADRMFRKEMKKLQYESASRPTSSKHWGWCSDNCYLDSYRTKRLQEAMVDVLTSEACEVLGRVENANPILEMCTGRKHLFPRIETYIRLEDSDNTWYERKV